MTKLIALFSELGRLLAPAAGWLEVQANRNRLYTTAVVLLPGLITAGYLTSGTAQHILTVLAIAAGAGVPGLASRHSTKGRHIR